MNPIYLDNAATTPLLPEVIETICTSMHNYYGNPSSTHQTGRKAKSLLETARKNIAKHFNAQSSEIYFTAGGSEADNLILRNAVTNLKVTTIISSKIEHHAVLHTIESLQTEFTHICVKWVKLNENGEVDYENLEQLLSEDDSKKIVSLMFVNNEIGTILNCSAVSELCLKYKAYFHTDAVQAVGHFFMDIKKTPIDFFVASAHKFHGPKGVGFAYIKKGIPLKPILIGGEQERGSRAGTENLHGIIGMEKALHLAYSSLTEDAKFIQHLKDYFIEKLNSEFTDIEFNGASENASKSSYVILNVRFAKSYPMLLFNLDLKGIAASGGSACQSGSNKGSHVLNELLSITEAKKTSIRFSFSKLNTKQEIDTAITVLKELIN
jgi:cysteine desulfurase